MKYYQYYTGSHALDETETSDNTRPYFEVKEVEEPKQVYRIKHAAYEEMPVQIPRHYIETYAQLSRDFTINTLYIDPARSVHMLDELLKDNRVKKPAKKLKLRDVLKPEDIDEDNNNIKDDSYE